MFLRGVVFVTNRQEHAPRSTHRHSWTVDPRYDRGHGICYVQDVGGFHYFIYYESFRLSHLLLSALSYESLFHVCSPCLSYCYMFGFKSCLVMSQVWFHVMFLFCLKLVSCLFELCL
jgi:hypothetical protein